MDPTTPAPLNNDRSIIARRILGFSTFGLAVISLVYVGANLFPGGDVKNAADKMFSAVLPLLGTWVGTVLAYYFSKENFESASRSVQNMAKQITADEKLRGIAVKDKFIPLAEMAKKKGDPGQIKLKADILDYLDAHKRSRLPLLTQDDRPVHVVHRSTVDKYLAAGLLAGTFDTAGAGNKTLADLLRDDPEAKKMLENSFAVVAENASMGAAKAAMERIPDCRDVFVTSTGQKTEPVLGWLTNIIISEAARV